MPNQDHTFARDPSSKGLVNQDVKSRAAYMKARDDRKIMDGLQKELNMVKDDLHLIREMLSTLINNFAPKG